MDYDEILLECETRMEEAVENDIILKNKFRKAKIPKNASKPKARKPISDQQRDLILKEA